MTAERRRETNDRDFMGKNRRLEIGVWVFNFGVKVGQKSSVSVRNDVNVDNENQLGDEESLRRGGGMMRLVNHNCFQGFGIKLSDPLSLSQSLIGRNSAS